MHCPQCHAPLAPSGTADVDGHRLTVSQGGDYTVPWTMSGESFDAALTFAVTPSGEYIHPETLEPPPLN